MLTTEYTINSGFGGGWHTSAGVNNYGKKSADGKTINWYVSTSDPGAYYQFNTSGTVYTYLAIG